MWTGAEVLKTPLIAKMICELIVFPGKILEDQLYMDLGLFVAYEA
jgi:hypothetical protein